MSAEPPDDDAAVAALARARRERLERAARLLGDLLPETTRDESPEGWGDERGSTSRDDELRRNVPPHHGGD